MDVEMRLELDVNELGGVQISILSFSPRGEKTAFSRADEMVDRDLLSRMEVILAEGTSPVLDIDDMTARSGTPMLSTILAGGTARWMWETCDNGVQATL
jgi:hypothetical protein